MNSATVAETLRQVIEGMDFAPAKRLVNIKADLACEKREGFPYSIATNIWHCDYWNRLWLTRLKGEKRPAKNIWAEDWQEPGEQDWKEVKERFLANLDAAFAIASAKPFEHAMKSDDDAIKVLNQIAVHTAYHVGQVALLKRALKAKSA
ncbi:MAG: DinB family protein [Chlorobia bacterium]|nr:DinB family protein [Fimbriimonadaceae bacterium]